MSKSHNPTATRILFSAADALQPLPARTWSVHGLFHRPGLFMLIGDPGSRKSFTAVDLAVCVAAGKPWLTRATQPGPVLFVDEQGWPEPAFGEPLVTTWQSGLICVHLRLSVANPSSHRISVPFLLQSPTWRIWKPCWPTGAPSPASAATSPAGTVTRRGWAATSRCP
ncbi:MAG: AAA family ATPase [Anaerolineales bacterium]|nr:AAA family ATPase [Anaerolineales bacterium]